MLLGTAALAGCAAGRVAVLRPGADTVRPLPRPGGGNARAPGPGARTPEALDAASQDERAAALEAAQAGAQTRIGRTIATLGDPMRPGFWLETPLLAVAARGRVVHAQTGASVAVDLIPIAAEPSAGSRLSLAAMRLLGVALTDLPELIVYVRQ